MTHEQAKDRSTVLAEERTVMAAERTLMAWIRTAVSLVGFGFTIFKFFQYLGESTPLGRPIRPYGPRNLGLTLIALGTLSLVAAALQHRQFLKQLGYSEGKVFRSLSFIVAIFMVLIGVLAFIGVFVRSGPF